MVFNFQFRNFETPSPFRESVGGRVNLQLSESSIGEGATSKVKVVQLS
jgi:hypothetical protein